MSTKRKISVRKIIQTLVTLLVVSGCTVAMLSADRRQSTQRIKDVQLRVLSTNKVHFLTEDMVNDMLFTARHINPKNLSVKKVDERSMEAILKSNPWVGEAQVYTDNERVMHITVSQRVPVVRLFENDGNSYYLDAALKAMPISKAYTHYTPVVTGVPPLRQDSVSTAKKGEIVNLVQWIGKHPFWNAQISQVSMRPDGGFELMPVLGKQRIILGDTSRLEDKLNNLFAFYKQIQNKLGWDKYNTIDLRYADQIVASPSLPWKAPAQKLSTIDWVKGIIDSAPAKTDLLGGDAAANADQVDNAAQQPVPAPAAPKPATPAQVVPKPQPAHAHAVPTRPAAKAAQTKPIVPQAKPKVPPKLKAKAQAKPVAKPAAAKPTNSKSRPEKNKKSNAVPKH